VPSGTKRPVDVALSTNYSALFMLRRSIVKLGLATLPLGLCLSLSAQGTFQVLDFEEANPVSIGGLLFALYQRLKPNTT
jgi:hypothetical protein